MPQATALTERIHTIDMLRGFALLGIILANMAAFKALGFSQYADMVNTSLTETTAADQAVNTLLDFFVIGKFYPLFSFLFGLGFYMFYQRLTEKNFSADRIFQRRLLFLLFIGTIHLVFLWSGDILHLYAVTGFFLLMFTYRSSKAVLTWALGLIFASGFFMTLLLTAASAGTASMSPEPAERSVASGISVMKDGSYIDILTYRLSNEVIFVLLQLPFSVPFILGLFLLGFYFGRRNMFTEAAAHLRTWKRLFIHSLWLGLILNAVVTALKQEWITLPGGISAGLGDGLNYIAGPVLTLWYVSSFVLAAKSQSLRHFLLPFASMGRLALTNYLMQTIIAVLLFHGYGLGLFGEVSVTGGFITALVIYIVQLAGSHWYMKKFSQGPIEYLWRKWTYARTA
ncbi:hypothetical protein CHL76_06490 [Marinococcus halophilus]|uniref:DUF418 domain-containing protein n=1 Tax=Marinococcus halophilus TaxID=1371 RepID=A0A510Y939_MARHA|nr:DUF418 domain-containing protein [Marinococcus halophilus]OZT80571.1 hypothetical protein CHL76_06490 [Marinococcus halophilus]GEK58927.1 hypothetical protein MHA01_18320 [Marinococcus halophilus]